MEHTEAFPRLAAARREGAHARDGQTYGLIVCAARDLIRTNGYASLTVDDVRRRAGISRATFYFYFRNLTQLLIHAGNAVMAELFEVVGRHYPERDEYSRIVLANVEYLQVWSRERELLGNLFAHALIEPEIREFYGRCRREFERRLSVRISRLIRQQRIPPVNADLLAATLSSMVEFAAYRFFVMPGDTIAAGTVLQDLVQVLSENWYRAVYGGRPPATYDYAGCLPAPPTLEQSGK
jgi:AcrR family transcriptional regulator